MIGSRMTGAGFGGCTVSIVKTDAIDSFIEKVGEAYRKKIGYAADFMWWRLATARAFFNGGKR